MTPCSQCGRTGHDAAARFCPDCGAALPAPPASASDEGSPPASAPPAGTTINVQQDIGSQTGGRATGVDLGGVTGPVTVNQQGDSFKVQLGNVGAGSQVAVGKQIRQGGSGAAAYTAADRAALAASLAAVRAALAAPELPADRQLLGAEFLRQLEATLTRPDGPPEAATLQVCGDWLLTNLPGLRPTLAAAFASPAGVRALAAAGEAAEAWGRDRLGVGG